MIRIGLISDTHIPYDAKVLPSRLKQVFGGVDFIYHCGDIYVSSVLDELQQLAPVIAAQGDDDFGEILKDQRVKQKHMVSLNGSHIWVVHVREYPKSLFRWRVKQDEEAGITMPDIMVYGHSHSPSIDRYDDILYVNPGSATFPQYNPKPGTVGILSLNGHQAEAEIIQL